MNWLFRRLLRIADKRAPDIKIGGDDNPYLNRWYVIPRNRLLNIYLHQFLRSDDDRALHDHPWPSLSVCLAGQMTEITSPHWMPVEAQAWVREGDWRYRGPRFAHRLVLDEHMRGKTWTLFITGPKVREWGFWCLTGFVHWREFTAGPRGESIGMGCGE